MSQYNKLSDIQYARFQILPMDLHFGLFWSADIHHGVTSMLLYCLFLNRLLKKLRDLNAGCTINGIFTEAMCLAVACLYESCM